MYIHVFDHISTHSLDCFPEVDEADTSICQEKALEHVRIDTAVLSFVFLISLTNCLQAYFLAIPSLMPHLFLANNIHQMWFPPWVRIRELILNLVFSSDLPLKQYVLFQNLICGAYLPDLFMDWTKQWIGLSILYYFGAWQSQVS